MPFNRVLRYVVTVVLFAYSQFVYSQISFAESAIATEGPWTVAGGLTHNAIQLIRAVRHADRQGLSPEMYYDAYIESIAETNGNGFHPSSINSVMDRTFHKLAADLAQGTVDPTKVQNHWYRQAPRIDTAKLYALVAAGTVSVEDALEKIKPASHAYAQLTHVLEEMLSEHPVWTQVPVGPKLKSGHTDPRVRILKHRLIESGDLQPTASTDDYFDEPLHNAVLKFQNRHGLRPDGIVASATIAALNVPAQKRIDQIRLNLERMRWMPRNPDGTRIVINIPEFKLHMFNNGVELLELPVVTGKAEYQTPVFSETMKKIVVAPTWVVPRSIADKELVPIERGNPGYFKKENIGYYYWSKGKLLPVSESSVTAETLLQNPFPYVLQQGSGEGNALGRIKFLMPNNHDIYLHDTSAKNLFQKTERAFSHGCIRVASPELLGSVLLQMDGYDQKETENLLAKEETTTVNLENHVQTDIVYYTSWVDNEGTLHFRDDIYNHDNQLLAALNQRKRYRIAQVHKMRNPILAAAMRTN